MSDSANTAGNMPECVLILAENSTQATSIASAVGATQRRAGYREGGGYLVSWCGAARPRLAAPEDYNPALKDWKLENLPISPDKIRHIVPEKGQKQFHTLEALMNRPDVRSLICATDASREGEQLFRQIYELTGCSKPWKRLWLTSLTPEAICQGMQTLRHGQAFDGLAVAARCREEADWLIGVNLSRYYSASCHRKFLVGRVKTPVLAMVVRRQEEIEHFQPTSYQELSCQTEDGAAFCCRCSAESVGNFSEFATERPNTGTISIVHKEQKILSAPPLYNLSALQQDANRLFGYTASQTLAVLETLYQDGLCIFPGVTNRCIFSGQEEGTRELLERFSADGLLSAPAEPFKIEKLVRETATFDHPALLPTETVTAEMLRSLNRTAQNILTLLVYRLAEAVSQDAVLERQSVELTVSGAVLRRESETVLQEGWLQVRKERNVALSLKNAKKVPVTCLNYREGQTVSILNWRLREVETRPPEPYTDAALLAELECAGVGTPSARGAVFDALVRQGYLLRRGRDLLPTAQGKALIRAVSPELCDLSAAEKWERRLQKIEQGAESPEELMEDVKSMICRTLRQKTTAFQNYYDN